MEELKGKIINKVFMNDENTIMIFETSTGERIGYETYGDCCSYSWFSHINNLENLLGSEILEVVEKEESGRDATEEEYKDKSGVSQDTSFDSLAVYMYTLKTQKGHSDIEFRNDSNGYYGGWCSIISDPNVSNLREITNDL